MITYNFEKYRIDNNNAIEGIYWYIRDSDHSEGNFQIGHYTKVALEKEITPEEALVLVKSVLGAEAIAEIEAEFPLLPAVLEKIMLAESEADLRETG